MPDLIAVYITRVRDKADRDFIATLRYAYEGKPPSLRKRTEMAKDLLSEVLDHLEEGEPVDLGFAEDTCRRVRTDKMEA